MRVILLLAAFLSLSGCTHEPALRWWKGNLHTHSLWSDGDDYPEMIVEWYKQRGYHFLALSDHNILSDHQRWIDIEKSKGGELAFDKYLTRFGERWVEQRNTAGVREVRLKMLNEFRGLSEESGRFLMIPSEEISGRFLTAPIHVNATNIRELIKPPEGRSIVDVMQKMVDAVNEQRQRTKVPMFPHINHPNFGWALTAEELMQINHDRFFEVYNGHPMVHNDGDKLHASTERVWDIILAERLAVLGKEVVFGMATDDSHNYHNEPANKSRPGRGWVMVRAATLRTEDLIAAMEAGDFYASSGVTLRELHQEQSELSFEIEPEPGVNYLTEFIGTRQGYDRTSQPVLKEDGTEVRATRRYSNEIGTILAKSTGTTARYSLKADEIYVRARITSSKVKADPSRADEFEQAWTQPVVHRRSTHER